jgi:hypothetical protein
MAPAKLAERLATPRSLYTDDAIDSVGKAFIPMLEVMITNGTTVDEPGFPARFLATAREALGPALDAPKLRLRTSVVAYDGETFWKSARELRDRVFPVGMDVRQLDSPEVAHSLGAYTELSAALIVRRDALDRLRPLEKVLGAAALERVAREARAHKGFVLALPRTPRATIYVFVSDDEAGHGRLIDAFASALKPLEGKHFAF